MAQTLADLADAAEEADEPAVTTPPGLTFGGVDPLGLRQINFDLMDQVFPGINNVVRHIRPFTVVTWAWRRAARIADQMGQTRIAVPTLMDFVARIEVAYVWSQLIRNPKCELPGRDVLAPLVNGPGYYLAMSVGHVENLTGPTRSGTVISALCGREAPLWIQQRLKRSFRR